MSLPKSVINKRMARQLSSIESPTEFPVRRSLGDLFREKGSPAYNADSPAHAPQSMPNLLQQATSPMNNSVTSSSSSTGSPWLIRGPDLRKNLALADYDYDSSPAAAPSPLTLVPYQGVKSSALKPNSVSPSSDKPDFGTGRSPGAVQGGCLDMSPVQREVPDSPVTSGRLRRSSSFRKLLHSPSPNKRPALLAFDDENSCDSGYASLPTEDLQLQSKRSRHKAEDDPAGKENVVDNWFSGLGGCGPSPSPSLSFKSNTSSLDLDGFPLETIPELAEEEEGGGTSSATACFTSLLSNTMLVPQPSSSSTPTLRRSSSMLSREPQYSPQPSNPPGGFKKPSVPVRQAGPITRSMLRSQNETRKRLVELKEDQPDVLPDGSKKYCLPSVTNPSHPDLRTISSHTLADLIGGKYNGQVSRFRILDARYSFEFSGGHITGAESWEHGQENTFLSSFLPASPLPAQPVFSPESEGGREILIFHCEFSSQRGPDFYRKLRNRDREINSEVFPALHYPECYLLQHGYKEFFRNYPELCTGGYTEMADDRYKKDLRSLRAKSRSWAGGTVSRISTMRRRKH